MIKEFDNLAQRAVYYFTVTYPSFTPIENADVSADEQRRAHEFIGEIYEKLYSDPSLLGFKPAPDDAFEDWQQQKEKPQLSGKIRKSIQKIEDFTDLIYRICLAGEVRGDAIFLSKDKLEVKAASLRQLANFGITSSAAAVAAADGCTFTFPNKIAGALKLLAEISLRHVKAPKDDKQKPYLLFSRGIFDPFAPYTREVFGNMLDDEGRASFYALTDFLDEAGYTRIDNKEFNNRVALDYIKNYGDPNAELKWAWSERTRGGIEVVYHEVRRNQLAISMRIPYFDKILAASDKMPPDVKSFITGTSKKCDNCRYCVQTDKTGKRPLRFVKIGEYNICPLFCGFQYTWKSLTPQITANIIALLKFIDTLFS
jgi:hypothetical protein